MNNPAIKLDIDSNGTRNTKWIMKRYPVTWTISGKNSIQFIDVFGAQYTGLQVRRDPGVWIVYLGCLIMSIGLYMAFFTTHRRLHILITPGKGSSHIKIAASAHKGREAYERKIDNLISNLQSGGK